MEMQLPEDFKEFLRLLNSNGVEYLLIGGFAVGYYGYPRATNDIDVWVSRTESNSKKLVATVEEFGLMWREISPIMSWNILTCVQRQLDLPAALTHRFGYRFAISHAQLDSRSKSHFTRQSVVHSDRVQPNR